MSKSDNHFRDEKAADTDPIEQKVWGKRKPNLDAPDLMAAGPDRSIENRSYKSHCAIDW